MLAAIVASAARQPRLQPLLTSQRRHLMASLSPSPSASPSHPFSSSSSSSSPIAAESIARLRQHTACDVSDALLKLKSPAAGFIADLNVYGKPCKTTTIAPVSTVLFAAKGQTPTSQDDDHPLPPSNLPANLHWTDVVEPDSFVVIKQPPGQINAVCGGIMALRIKIRGAKGIAVAGRVRDVAELTSTELPVMYAKILAYGTSTVGAGAGSVAWALQVPIDINGVTVKPGDVAFHDPDNGFVVIPRDKLPQVLNLMPKLVAADDKVKEDVGRGSSVHDAFALHRGG
ncbi:hypothetical protein L249_8498 [Ophiocordyceps polyrhachis-furcata BCC 54312]|uniref:DlpA domain-containing protein n=1 Tax=Ophiocordyceps polyrhachis-furcata BCC 54312 TaxID=1330021 RepID=A0A367L6F6_9HYPO|nr:hypothetical protein L249_8498 [Ophiocordyceps polyrhachis-furcata BCC 54312]